MEVTMKVEGMDRALESVKHMEIATQRKIVNKAIKRAAKPVLEEMRAKAPTADNDSILDNIGIRAKRKGNKWLGYKIGVVTDKGKKMKNFNAQALAASIEYGTKSRKKKSGASTGQILKKPFLRPAIDKHASSVARNVEQEIVLAVDKASRK